MSATIWTIITGVIGILGTVIAWYLNPNRQRYAELDKIFIELDGLYKKRDVALEKNDNDILTAVAVRINELRKRKDALLQRK